MKIGSHQKLAASKAAVWTTTLLCLLSSLKSVLAAKEVIIGNFTTRGHDLEGVVVALSDRLMEVRGMRYDGLGPDTFFWGDKSATPSDNGFLLLDGPPGNACGGATLPKAEGETFQFEFPAEMTIHDIVGGSISVWCEQFSANFGEVVVSSDLDLSILPVSGVADAPDLICSKEVTIGNFTTRAHELAGTVVALSDRVMEVRQMVYDGLGPDTFFWVDESSTPSDNGMKLLDGPPGSACGEATLPEAKMETFRFEFPSGSTIHDFIGGSISVWCEQFSANFGEVVVPNDLDLSMLPATGAVGAPSIQCNPTIRIGNFTTRAHELEGEVYALSDRVMEVRNMVYDGLGPDTFFWADTNALPTDGGFKLLDAMPSNACGEETLPEATGETFRFEFPSGMTIHDIVGGSISVWCEEFSANFGEVVISADLDLSMLPVTGVGAAPELTCSENPSIADTPQGYSCEELTDDYQVRWKVLEDDQEIMIELIGRIEEDGYMAFGVSGASDRALMVGADPVVANFFEGQPRARDYYMSERAQCAGAMGVCPDFNPTLGGPFTDDVVAGSVSGVQQDGLTLVRFKRPFVPTDNVVHGGHAVDQELSAALTTVVWALGPIDGESGDPFFHSVGVSRDLIQFDFSRGATDNCTPLSQEDEEEEEIIPFLRPVLTEVTEFQANIGPSGGERGYAAISEGRTAWGIAWWLNDVLIPVIEMRRGTKYTFRVNGGNDPASTSEYHPFYLTDSVAGGYFQRSASERLEEQTFGGISVTNQTAAGVVGFESTTVAPICSYSETPESTAAAAGGFPNYVASLGTECPADVLDSAAVLEFTPDANTPDAIYYQCVTHRNLGWEIHVIDADAPSILDVNCDALGTTPVMLTADLMLNTIIDPINNVLKVEMTYNGIGWVGMAFTNNQRLMVGAEAVIGLPGDGTVKKYSLNAREVAGVVPLPESQQTLMDTSITQTGSKTVLKFTKHLVEAGEHPIFTDIENTFLFAHGSGNSLGFHSGFGGFEILPNQCAVRVKGELQNEYALNRQGDVGVEVANTYRELWVAHGACAATAWGILIPLAVGASLIRKVLIKMGLPESAWFHLHRGLNMLAAILTICAFSIAVAAINKTTDPEHFEGVTHRRTGLVIFILTMAQAINGILRPHAPKQTAVEESENTDEDMNNTESRFQDTEDGEKSTKKMEEDEHQAAGEAAAQKTTVRKGWEIFHRLLGVTLLGLAWWQVQDGLGLFAERFDEENLDNVFWIVVACIAGSVAALAVYARVAL